MKHLCNKCQVTQPCGDFYRDPSKSCGHHSVCKSCVKAARMKNWYADHEKSKERLRSYYRENTEKFKGYHLKRLYGLTVERFAAMLTEQGGACAICRCVPDAALHVDHNHASNAVRGLLCDVCNRGLGFFKDDAETLRRAAAYVATR